VIFHQEPPTNGQLYLFCLITQNTVVNLPLNKDVNLPINHDKQSKNKHDWFDARGEFQDIDLISVIWAEDISGMNVRDMFFTFPDGICMSSWAC